VVISWRGRGMALLAWGLMASSWGQAALPAKIVQLARDQGVDTQQLSVLVLPLERTGVARGEELALQAARPMNPASTMKLLTTLVSLEQLGPTYRWRTALLSEAPVQAGVLQGPLYLRGGGDPALGWEQLGSMLRSLRAQGISRIEGDLVLDRQYFTPNRPDQRQPPFDDYPDAYYNVVPDAALVGSNLLSFSLSSSTDSVDIQMLPPLAGVVLENGLKLTDMSCHDWGDELDLPQTRQDPDGSLHLTLLGGFPRNCKTDLQLNVLDRNVYIERVAKALWQELGGSWQGSVHDGSVPAGARLLVERRSETLADLVKQATKRSDNTMVRTLYLTLGVERAQRQGSMGDTLADARLAVQDWLTRHDIDPTGLVLENGAGLSRLERITPAQLAAVLRVGALSDWSAEYQTSLPIAALDGTMRNRLHGTVAAGRARIKTGSLDDVAAVAGYVRDSADRSWVLVAIANQPQALRARPVLDALIEWVASGQAGQAARLGRKQKRSR